MKIAIYGFFILFQFTLLAQGLTIKTNPLYLLDNEKYTMPVGLEYSVGNLGIQLEQMFLLSKQTNDGLITHRNYNKTNVQFRYYLNGLVFKDLKLFVGLHGTRRTHDYWETSGEYVSTGGLDIRHSGSLIEAKNLGVYYIFGARMALNSKLALEFVSGFGFRELSIQHNPESFIFVDDIYYEFGFDERRFEGTRTLGAFLGQVRINYKLF